MHHELVPPAALPVPFAVSTLMQPGPVFLDDLSDTGLDSSTVLPQTRQSTSHSKQGGSGILSAQQNGVAELWQSTAWGPGTAHRFSLEALTSLSTAIGTVGSQLAVLTLCHTDLADAAMQQLCKGIGR